MVTDNQMEMELHLTNLFKSGELKITSSVYPKYAEKGSGKWTEITTTVELRGEVIAQDTQPVDISATLENWEYNNRD